MLGTLRTTRIRLSSPRCRIPDAYNSYYVPTENWLKSQGIDISGRADCVKGMVWGLSNMWGTGGVRNVLLGANLSNDMTDREFVTALSQQITDHIEKYSSQTEYYAGWKNRYRSELADCLAYIAEDEAAAAEEEKPAPEPAPETPEVSEPETPETPGDAGGQGSAADEGGSSDANDSADNGNAGSGGDASSEDASGDKGDDATDSDFLQCRGRCFEQRVACAEPPEPRAAFECGKRWHLDEQAEQRAERRHDGD